MANLPANLDAERAVLGACLLNRLAWADVGDVLQPDHFFREAHRYVFAAISAVIESRQDADVVTVKAVLDPRGQLDAVGGPAYLASLTDGVPRSLNARSYG